VNTTGRTEMTSGYVIHCGEGRESNPAPPARDPEGARSIDDLQIIGRAGVTGMVLASPEDALEVARCVAALMPEGCPHIVLFDCDWMEDRKALAAIERFLAPDSKERLTTGLLLFRELHALQPACQRRLAALAGARKRDASALRIMASTSVVLFDELPRELFDSELYYMLNTVTVDREVLKGRTVRARPRIVRVGTGVQYW
jgi:hypothetical protein